MPISDFAEINPQLTLAIQPNHEANLHDFCWSGNEQLQQQIQALLHSFPLPHHPDILPRHAEVSSPLVMYLWGACGTGKSYLLQAICQEASKQGASVAYLPLKLLRDWSPAILEGMADYHIVAVDDIEQIVGHKEWEEALFHLYNRLHARNHKLLFTSLLSTMILPLQLADLRSRLSCALIFQVHELNDENKIRTLQTRAKKCGLELPNSVGQYLLNHCARNMHDLQGILERLDHASLVAQRKITIPFVKDVLSF